jgi:hypothetical protein
MSVSEYSVIFSYKTLTFFRCVHFFFSKKNGKKIKCCNESMSGFHSGMLAPFNKSQAVNPNSPRILFEMSNH